MDLTTLTEKLPKQLENILSGNSLTEWLVALTALAIGLVLILLFKWVAVGRIEALARKTSTRLDDALALALRKTQTWILFFPPALPCLRLA